MKRLLLLFNLIAGYSIAQVISPQYYSSYDPDNGMYRLKADVYSMEDSFKPDAFLTDTRLKLNLVRKKTDALGMTHLKYVQTLDGVPIDGAEFMVHRNRQGVAELANGYLIASLDVKTAPSLSAEEALTKAIRAEGASKYRWEVPAEEEAVKQEGAAPMASYYPSPTLVLAKNATAEYRLCYKMRIHAQVPFNVTDYYIDAASGSVVKKHKVLHSCFSSLHNPVKDPVQANNSPAATAQFWPCNSGCQQGSATTKWYGQQGIMTDHFTYGAVCRYRPKNTCTSTFLYVRDNDNGTPDDYRNNGNTWGTNDQHATTALWSIERVHDYFTGTHNRNSFDDQSSQVNVHMECVRYDANANQIFDNAFWDGSNILVVPPTTTAHELTTLDVLGHEFTHGINDYEANLTYAGESGALDESFADIFGTCVEFFGKQNFNTGTSTNWLIGEEVFSGGLRDMGNPNVHGDPDTFGGVNWFNVNNCTPTSNNDQCGVHTNSGVQNFWFFLLVNGGANTNDNNQAYCVQGIGMLKAAQIAYRNLTTYLNSGSNYANARAGSIQSAIDLFGPNSNEVAQVTAAWFAVGVGANYNGTIDLKNQTISGILNHKFNSRIEVQNVTMQATSDVEITSNTEIAFLQAVSVIQGARLDAFIAPNCNGNGARLAGGQTEAVETVTEESPSSLVAPSAEHQGIVVVPNPSFGEFEIRLEGGQVPDQVLVEDVLGHVIARQNDITASTVKFEMGGAPAGIYLIRMSLGDQVVTRKIVKE